MPNLRDRWPACHCLHSDRSRPFLREAGGCTDSAAATAVFGQRERLGPSGPDATQGRSGGCRRTARAISWSTGRAAHHAARRRTPDPLLGEHDLDNYAYPLMSHLDKQTTRQFVSVWCTKKHADASFVRVGPAVAITDSLSLRLQATCAPRLSAQRRFTRSRSTTNWSVKQNCRRARFRFRSAS